MATIRPYEDRDEDAVIALWELCGLTRAWNDPAKDIARKKTAGAELFLVLENPSGIVGVVMGGYDGHRGVMNYLAVHPGCRGRGYAAQLVKAIEERLVEMGCPKINLMVRADNAAAGDFYVNLDYKAENGILVFGKRLIPDD